MSKKVEIPFNVIDQDIIGELKKNYIIYANELNKHRAIPYILNGLKPIAAHIIWAMKANNRTHNKNYTKSAKVTGEIMNYSPHGDSYDSCVRLAQDFIYHIPYIDGHGSFGSAIGGPTPGASRYTEMRLSKFIEDVLLYNTDLLDMGLNYLEEDEEPIINNWVALLPLMFITNTTGMGYATSQTWSSGNLYEFREQLLNYLNNGEVDCSNIYPDFPTGGIIVNKSDMKSLYENGKGTIKLRGKAEVDGNTIRILSLPYQKYPEQFIEDIKKYVANNANTIKDVANMCGMNGFLIEIECDDGTAEYTLETLYKKTCLQISISDEHKAVMPNGEIKLVSLKDYIECFVNANIELVKKEAQLNLDKISSRLEIVDGLLSALDIIDDIIKEIKSSKSMDDAKKTLMTKTIKGHKFTERQADAIVHTPLGRLANLEKVKLQDEKEELEKKKAENENLLVDYNAQKTFFLNRFNSLIDKYAWERKTEVIDVIIDEEIAEKIKKPRQLKVKKEYMIVLTAENCLKRVEVSKFRATSEDEKTVRVQGNERIVLVSNRGNMYKVFSNKIDVCMPAASGTDIATIRPEINDEKIIAIYSSDVTIPYVYFVTKEGMGKKVKSKDVIQLSKDIGTTVCGMKTDTDEVIAIKLLNENENIEITTTKRKLVVESGKPQGRPAVGHKVIELKKDETITEVHSI